MRLAFLSSTPAGPTEGSGTFVAVDGIARGLAGLGHEVTVRPLRLRTRFHTLDRWLYNAGLVLRPPAADVVVGVDLDGFLWSGRRAASPAPRAPGGRAGAARPPYVVTLKGVIADERRHERGWVRVLLGVQARWERANARRADRVLVSSRYSAQVAAAAYGLDEARLAVVPEAVDISGWRRRFLAASGVAVTRPTVLAVARMYPRKRLADLLEAAHRLRRRLPDLAVRIVGEGPEFERLRRRHRQLDLDGTVTFLGHLSRAALAVEYVSAHCFCLPSIQEGFGVAFVEAMAAGLPVVACRAAAVPEVVPDRQAGLLVMPRRPDELAGALEALLADERLRKEYGEAGRRHAERFALDRVAATFLEALPR